MANLFGKADKEDGGGRSVRCRGHCSSLQWVARRGREGSTEPDERSPCVRTVPRCLTSDVTPIIADLSIGVSTPRTHLGALQVNPACRYGLKKDFWFAGNSSQPPGRGQAPSNLPPHLPPLIPHTFPHVDQAEGGDENQLHNSAHNSAFIANQDVVAAQLTAMQQQSGVFQQVLAQLLARNNPGDPLINLLNPVSQPPAPQQNPEPVQHAAAIKKLVAEQRGAPPPHHAADSIPHPLNTNITLEPYPASFRIPLLETYDGTKDPDDHLHAFYSCMQAQNSCDALMCKIFPSTLRCNARTWLIRKTTSELMRVRQRDGESLKNFMSRFNDVVLEVNSFDQAVGITAVISGLSHERFRDSLLKHPATTFSEVNDRSLKFITAEEYALSQNPAPIKNQNPDWRDENPNRKRMKTTQNRGSMSTSTPRFGRLNSAPPQQPAGKPPVTWTPFNLPRSQIFMQIKNKMDLRHPGPMKTAPASRDHTRYSEQPRFVREQGPQPQGVHNPPNRQGVGFQQALPPLPPPDRIIHMITGGLEAGGLSSKQRKLYVRERYDGPIYGFNNQPVPVEGVLTMNVAFGSGRSYVTPSVKFLVVKMAFSFNVVIGRPTLTEIQVVVSQSHLCMKFPTPTGIATLRGNQEVARHCYITSVTQPQKGKDQTPEANPKQIPDNRQVMGVEIVDNRPEDETRAAPVEDVEEVQIDDRDPTRKTQIGTRLSSDERTELIAFLRANKDVFAWTSADMLGIPTSVSQHKLSTNPLKKPVAQKRRLFGGESLKVIKEEVEKLLQAGFVRRVNYCEWVANPVLVKKANGKWRMCIDYTNLNDACPKDCYPMPNIDKLVEAASGNERLSLLDAYSGYHQVLMAPEDEEKTSFYAGDEIYCYVMMPFGLKNVGATYQKLVTIVFRAQIGRNLEVYVDDIVVKSLKAEDHLADLEETFNNLRKNRMRLNPAKCIFGVELRKFLGFIVSRRGIEVNPEKIKAVAEMEPPKSVKDVQRLTGRVAALHRYISKSADKCLPFFKIMRLAAQKDESGKQKKFVWNSECQAAFDELKSYLSSPPLLTKADDGEILYLYLGISDEAISSVLKAALAVVTSARKLRPYIQSHPIIVLTDQPLRQILQKPECSGRLIKWAVELGEFEITFQQRSAIRAQALADFIIECTPGHPTPNSEPNDWTLYVDGASSSKGSGAGALLIGPNGYRSEHALKFNFNATNNMAEYKALLLGLQLALELKISAIQVYSDSQLVVNQINSICEVVDPVMVKYVALVASRVEMQISEILRAYLLKAQNDGDKREEMKLRKKASRYTLVNDVLYKRSFSLPLLRCLNPYEAEYALREVHEGVCGSYISARTLAHKVLRQGYYWPNMYKDATHFVQRCSKCQFFAHLTHQPVEELTNMVAPWPFAQWGLDLLGPFVKGVDGVTHLIVGVDYFTKWVEARALSSFTSKKVKHFVFSLIICKYRISNQIVADNGTQFNCSSFRDFCSSYGIKLQFTSVYHPESNGMVESVNKCILEGIKPRLEQHKAKWADELNNILWAYRTTSHTATGETPYHLAFGTEAVIPLEIGVPSFRATHFDEGRNGQLLWENLDLLDELAPNWEGPYTVAEVPHPDTYILRDTKGKRVPRVWNVNNLKKFYP
ncbi:hypothetical protein SLEP1_g58821 [Rubroshorea leprosula]|uniref:Uncharacterized protein n=1 Tax=Rubroshorea leprosula TaxID=152421 RepID=A0AAV5MRQ4_9ROSI|nr:hypothetical protein SLEP1_g58821 [Rubroshorea leprosula]